ncbi:MAG: Na(+)-translocating NADH-quinone reductase subunit A [Bacteroidales bacterium]|nr:Na(+)-translocating NADH-quinone reductase subunit A [Bacteroidales bacterium]
MADRIIIKKGLDLPIGGAAEQRLTDASHIATYAVKPTDFVGLQPRLQVAEGDSVEAGGVLFVDKNDERIRFTSPVAGTVKAIVRGEKRKLLAVVVEHTPPALRATSPNLGEELSDTKEAMLRSGLWSLLRQRPFGTIPSPDSKPKAIVISCCDSAPLAPDCDFLLQGREDDFVKGLEALATLTDGPLHVCFRPDSKLKIRNEELGIRNCSIHEVTGPHPAGNVGTLIARLCPINKGDQVWTMNPQDIATLGHLMRTGEYRPERVIAVAGPAARNPHYYRVLCGACMESIVKEQLMNPSYPEISDPGRNIRVISGDVLSGEAISHDGFLGAYDSLLTLLTEGDYYDFMGWLMPGLKKYSFGKTFLSGIMRPFTGAMELFGLPQATYRFDTNVHGSVRPLVFTGNFERVFPFDIYPLQLLKACIIGDVELQEKLGIYEVEPEDFALCEFIDTSKTDIQPIIREALEKLRKEAI